jgi:hypothetical protein
VLTYLQGSPLTFEDKPLGHEALRNGGVVGPGEVLGGTERPEAFWPVRIQRQQLAGLVLVPDLSSGALHDDLLVLTSPSQCTGSTRLAGVLTPYRDWASRPVPTATTEQDLRIIEFQKMYTQIQHNFFCSFHNVNLGKKGPPPKILVDKFDFALNFQ